LGKSQLKANTVAEADRDILKKQGQELLAKLQKSEPEGKLDVGIIKDLLPIADGLEEGIRAGQKLQLVNSSVEIGHINSWLEGMRIVHNRVLELLKKWNVRQMKVVGETFDPHSHIAVGVEHTSEVPENTIVEEQQKGYLLGNEVIRYAEVIVAKEVAESEMEPISIEKVAIPFVASVKEELEPKIAQMEDKSALARQEITPHAPIRPASAETDALQTIRPSKQRRRKDDFIDLCFSIIILAIDFWKKGIKGARGQKG
jgi:molecular chaperone GrpE (heat shock protein)